MRGGYGPDRICGAVDYTYNIGKYEVTAGQYTRVPQRRGQDRHLRAVQHEHVVDDRYGCKIQRSGTSGSYTYSVAADWANRPVNYVSFWDALPVCQLAAQRPADRAAGCRRPPRTARTRSTATTAMTAARS